MARRRMIDPNLWQSEDVAKLTIRQRLLLVGLFSNADDYGRGRANPTFIRSIIFPYDDIATSEIQDDLDQIAHNISVSFYVIDDSKYYEFRHWEKWQTVQKPQPSKIPPYEGEFDAEYGTIPERVENDSGVVPEKVQTDSSLKEVKGKEVNIIPVLEIVTHLNQQAKTSYRHTSKKTKELIRARWKDGFTLDDFKSVIDIKSAQWLNDPKMVQYLRPETLFGTKFESYLNQLPPKPPPDGELPFSEPLEVPDLI